MLSLSKRTTSYSNYEFLWKTLIKALFDKDNFVYADGNIHFEILRRFFLKGKFCDRNFEESSEFTVSMRLFGACSYLLRVATITPLLNLENLLARLFYSDWSALR